MTDTNSTPATPAPDTTPAVPADPAALAARDRELTALAETDLPRYRYADGGRLAEEHLAIRKAQEAAGKADPPPASEEGEAEELVLPNEGDDAGEVEEQEAEEAEEPEAPEREPLEPWTPPEGQEVAEYARPHLEALDGIVTDEKQREDIIGVYHQLLASQQAKHVEINKAAKSEAVADLKAEFGDDLTPFMQRVDAGFKELPQDFRQALRSARLPDGRLLLNLPDTYRALHRLGSKPAAEPLQQDRRTSMQAELQTLDQMMRTDIDAYNRRGYKGRDISASDRRLEIMREMDKPTSKPSAAALRSEEAELLALHQRDPQVFEYAPWKNTGKSGAQRLTELRSGRG